MRDPGDEFADGRELLTLDQLSLSAFECVHRFLQFLARVVQIFSHAIKHVGQLATFIF